MAVFMLIGMSFREHFSPAAYNYSYAFVQYPCITYNIYFYNYIAIPML